MQFRLINSLNNNQFSRRDQIQFDYHHTTHSRKKNRLTKFFSIQKLTLTLRSLVILCLPWRNASSTDGYPTIQVLPSIISVFSIFFSLYVDLVVMHKTMNKFIARRQFVNLSALGQKSLKDSMLSPIIACHFVVIQSFTYGSRNFLTHRINIQMVKLVGCRWLRSSR